MDSVRRMGRQVERIDVETLAPLASVRTRSIGANGRFDRVHTGKGGGKGGSKDRGVPSPVRGLEAIAKPRPSKDAGPNERVHTKPANRTLWRIEPKKRQARAKTFEKNQLFMNDIPQKRFAMDGPELH